MSTTEVNSNSASSVPSTDGFRYRLYHIKVLIARAYFRDYFRNKASYASYLKSEEKKALADNNYDLYRHHRYERRGVLRANVRFHHEQLSILRDPARGYSALSPKITVEIERYAQAICANKIGS